MTGLDAATAGHLAETALGHLSREYPNKPANAMAGPSDARTPRDLHPAFFGSFDWHSCVHGFWLLARLLHRFADLPQAAAIRARLDAQLTPAAIAGECATFSHPLAGGYERPYGWAWLLALHAALARHADQPWAQALEPLAELIAARFAAFLPRATYPVRVGTHFNTAFALVLVGEHPMLHPSLGGPSLESAARRWYGADEDCQAWEPGGDDFLSSALIEAECMRRLLPPAEFLPWFARFLPRLAQGQPASLFTPVTVSDRTDGKIAHLDGLNLSRAWCWRELAAGLPPGDPRHAVMRQAAAAHLAAGLPHVRGDYMGEHWLASFAVLALDGY